MKFNSVGYLYNFGDINIRNVWVRDSESKLCWPDLSLEYFERASYHSQPESAYRPFKTVYNDNFSTRMFFRTGWLKHHYLEVIRSFIYEWETSIFQYLSVGYWQLQHPPIPLFSGTLSTPHYPNCLHHYIAISKDVS